MASEPSAAPSAEADEDIVGDRTQLVAIGMIAVAIACLVFGALRLGVQLATGLATPWWGNIGGAVALALLYTWFRGSPERRSTVAVHGIALIATLALLIPAAYGMTSSKWWLSLVGFSVLLMGRRREAIVWVAVTLVLVPLTALVEPYITLPGAMGEPAAERVMAGLVYVALLLGVTAAFRRVAQQRARELADTALRLERANTVRGRFLAHMSHELRTPLHAVIAMTDLARTGDASPSVREHADAALASARVLLGLLNNVLDVTRAQADALELDARPFALHAALSEALRPLAAQARARGLELTARADPTLVERRVGDRVRVVQIALNLVSNALKFTERGSIRVRLAGEPEHPERVRIEVEDTGRGIPADRLDAVLEPFEQAERGDAAVQGGAGLGLAIVRELASRMDGSVHVESELARGSRFVVSLRLPIESGASEAGPEELLGAGASGDALGAPRTVPLRILVCEDDPTNRRVMRAMLTRLGQEATFAVDGVEGLALLRPFVEGRPEATTFDLVLTDVEMPGMTGIELARAVRALEDASGRERVRMVAVTAHVGEADQHRILEAGIDEHLPKPFALAALSAVLERASAALKRS